MIPLAQLEAARERLRGGIVETECRRSFALEERLGGDVRVALKAEFQQRTGSFKDRGALNKLLVMGEDARGRGVVAASAGNHAQALAFHAARLGVACSIVMPENAPLVKVANTKRHGAHVLEMGRTLSDGLDEVDRLADRFGRTPVHAFDDLVVAAGQGTMALEMLEQAPDATVFVVPVGGGGMISGVASAVKALKPDARVVGVEAEAAPTAFESLRAGEPAHVESADTLADGIAVKRIGDSTFPIVQALVDDVALVSEAEIAAAVFFLLERDKAVVEGAGAVGVAALLAGKVRLTKDETVACVLSGGNIDVNIISRLIDRGLWADGRVARFRVAALDRPGFLNELTTVVAKAGANVLDVEHARDFGDISVGDVDIGLLVETRGRDHGAQIAAELQALGYEVDEEI